MREITDEKKTDGQSEADNDGKPMIDTLGIVLGFSSAGIAAGAAGYMICSRKKSRSSSKDRNGVLDDSRHSSSSQYQDPRPELQRLLSRIASSLFVSIPAPEDPLSVQQLDAFIMALLQQRDHLTREVLASRLHGRMNLTKQAMEKGNLEEAQYQLSWLEKIYDEELGEHAENKDHP